MTNLERYNTTLGDDNPPVPVSLPGWRAFTRVNVPISGTARVCFAWRDAEAGMWTDGRHDRSRSLPSCLSISRLVLSVTAITLTR